MKLITTLTLFLFLISNQLFAQFGGCQCADAIDKDLKTDFGSFNRESFRTFLYDYIYASSSKRKQLKKSSSFGLNAIVDDIPIGLSSSGDSKSSALYTTEQEVKRTREVTDEHINTIITTFLPDRAYNSFDKCLEECRKYHEIINSGGILVSATEESDEIVTLQLKWNSRPAEKPVFIESADYTNGTALHGKKLIDGKQINDGQIIIETIKRDQEKDLIIVVNFKDSEVGLVKETIRAPIRTSNENVPIGTIVTSVLDYETFLSVNGIKDKNFNIKTSTWAPCDGRPVGGSTYGDKMNNVPDLRGLFIRGVNDMDVPGQPNDVDPLYKNEQEKSAGQRQEYALIEHQHGLTSPNSKNDGFYSTYIKANEGYGKRYHNESSKTTKDNSTTVNWSTSEVRPNNMSVYYYIRIN